MSLSIAIPGSTATQSSMRQAMYISGGTKSATVKISSSTSNSSTTQTVNCGTSCNLNLNVPVGQDTFAISLYSQTNGTGSVLSSGTTVANIVAGQSNNVSIAFGGVVSRVAISTGTSTVTTGSASQIPLNVVAYDAAGDIIVGSQAYATPITLKDTDASGATSLTNTNLTSPASTTAIQYTGNSIAGSAVVTANIAGSSVTTNSVSFTSSAPAANTAVPAHMKVYAVLAGNFHNTQGVDSVAQVQSAYTTIAKYVDYMETDNRASNYAHAAGMKVGFYTDPVQPHGGELTWSSSAFAHDCSGRVVVPNYPDTPELEGNVGSAALTSAWNTEIAGHLRDQWGTYSQDFVRSDDSAYPGNQSQGYFASTLGGAMEPAGVPYCGYSNSNYLSGLLSMFGQAAVPVLFNGATDPSFTSYVNGQANVMGGQCETCFGGFTGTTWQNHVNTEIAFVGQHKIFNSFSHGNALPAQQLYLYSSMLLGYDPAYTVLAMDIGTPSGIPATPLVNVVPMQPVTTEGSVSGYLTPEGVYVRQFGACYISQVSSGPCAVVVNADTATHNFPAILSGYHHTVNFSGIGIAHEFGDTGVVAATGSAPAATIPSMTANIVFN